MRKWIIGILIVLVAAGGIFDDEARTGK